MQHNEEEMEVDPQEFGEMVATVRMLEKASVTHATITQQMNGKLDTVLTELAVRKGKEETARRYTHILSGVIAACISWFVTYVSGGSGH